MGTPLDLKGPKLYGANLRVKNFTQSMGIVIGILLIIIGLSGAQNPEFMGLHLSPIHTLVMILSGGLSIWGATNKRDMRCFQVNFSLGIFFALHAIAGFLLGEPGTPGVGYDAPDELLLRIAPGFLELGVLDHSLHTFLSCWFLSIAISWRRRNQADKFAE